MGQPESKGEDKGKGQPESNGNGKGKEEAGIATHMTEQEIAESAKKLLERLEPILEALKEKDVEWREKMVATGKRHGRPRAPGDDGVFMKHLRDGPCKIGNVNELGDAEKEKQKALNDELAKMKKEAEQQAEI